MSICLGNSADRLIKEKYLDKIHNQMRIILKKIGINIYVIPLKIIKKKYFKDKGINNCIWVRDLFIKENKYFQLFNPLYQSNFKTNKINYRVYEINILYNFLCDYFNSSFLFSPSLHLDIKIEGGDIIEFKEVFFIGIGIRTNKLGVKFFKSFLLNIKSKKNIISIPHNALHLDCCFNILPNEKLILFDSDQLKIGKDLEKKIYRESSIENILDVKCLFERKSINFNLMLNYLYIYPNYIIISYKKEFENFYKYLRDNKYKVNFIYMNDIENDPRCGNGSIRCMSQWIDKPKNQILF